MLTATKRTIRLTPAQDRALRTLADRRGLSPYRTLLMAIDAGFGAIAGSTDRPADTREIAEEVSTLVGGRRLRNSGEIAEARMAYIAAEQVLERARDLPKLADAVDHLGHVAQTLGHDDEAERAFDKAAGLFETIKRYDAAADAYASLGKLHEAAGRKSEAEVALRQAIALAANIKEQDELAELYERLEALIASQP